MGDTILTAVDTVYGYGAGAPVARAPRMLEFEQGTFSLLLGGNGAGKSTIMRTVAGELTLQSGHFEFGVINNISVKDRIGFVPQRLKVPTNLPLTVEEFVLLGAVRLLSPFQRYTPKILKSAQALLEAVDLYQYRTVLLRHLSVGQLQRAGIVRELIGEPILLLLDESTAGVDREHQPHIFSLLSSRRSHLTVVLATHDLHHLSTPVDWVYSIDNGIISRASLGEVQCC